MQRVDPAVGELRRNAGLGRIIPPADARVVGIGGVGVVAMGEFRLHQPDRTEIAARDHRPHVPHQSIAGVAVVDGTNPPGGPRKAHDLLALCNGHGHRLFAEHVEAGSEKRPGDLEMRGIRRGDGDEIDPVGPVPFARQHLAPVSVRACGVEPEAAAIVAPGVRPMVKRARRENKHAVETRPEPMRRADLAALAAADDAPVETLHGRAPQLKPMARR